MPGDPTTSVFNDGYIAEMFDRWRADPAAVDTSWRQYFASAASLFGASSAPASGAAPGLTADSAAELVESGACKVGVSIASALPKSVKKSQ